MACHGDAPQMTVHFYSCWSNVIKKKKSYVLLTETFYFSSM